MNSESRSGVVDGFMEGWSGVARGGRWIDGGTDGNSADLNARVFGMRVWQSHGRTEGVPREEK